MFRGLPNRCDNFAADGAGLEVHERAAAFSSARCSLACQMFEIVSLARIEHDSDGDAGVARRRELRSPRCP
jgi:hypothetical protein